jgi:hypothetical protein
MPSAWRARFQQILAWARGALRWAARALRILLVRACWALGIVALVMIVLAFTRVPYDLHRWLGTAGGPCSEPPQAIVVLGGSGMPSGPELLRLYHAAGLAAVEPQAVVFVVHPGDTAVIQRMADANIIPARKTQISASFDQCHLGMGFPNDVG